MPVDATSLLARADGKGVLLPRGKGGGGWIEDMCVLCMVDGWLCVVCVVFRYLLSTDWTTRCRWETSVGRGCAAEPESRVISSLRCSSCSALSCFDLLVLVCVYGEDPRENCRGLLPRAIALLFSSNGDAVNVAAMVNCFPTW